MRSIKARRRCRGYIRVDVQPSAHSRLRQQHEIASYAERNRLVRQGPNLIDDGHPGTAIDNRVGLKKLLEIVAMGAIDVVIVEEMDRLSRSHHDTNWLGRYLQKPRVEL